MNYYISGQSGFLGKAITKYLNKKDWTDTLLCIPRGQSTDDLIKFFNRVNPDYIIHLASYGNHFYQQDICQMFYTNVLGLYTLLQASRGFNYKRFFNVSSSSVLLKKQTPYSLSKQCGELICNTYERTTNVRPYSVYGIGDAAHRFIPTVIKCLKIGESMVVDEDATHDWIFVDDFVKALFRGSRNIGTGIKTTNKEIILMLEDISGKKLNYTQGKFRDYDNDNWVAPRGVKHIDLYEGLKLTYEGYL